MITAMGSNRLKQTARIAAGHGDHGITWVSFAPAVFCCRTSSSIGAIKMSRAKGQGASATKKVRGVTSPELLSGRWFLPSRARIKLFVVAETSDLPVRDKRRGRADPAKLSVARVWGLREN